MSLSTLLKTSREACHFTQEEAAEHLNVSSQTISNWETNTSCPDMRSKENIKIVQDMIELYGISRENFLQEYNDQIWPAKEPDKEGFPTCLFRDEDVPKISTLIFTPQETEFIRMMFTYGTHADYSNGYDWLRSVSRWSLSYLSDTDKNSLLFRRMPYEYVYKVGIPELHQMAQSIYRKVRAVDDCNIEGFLSDTLLDTKYGTVIRDFNVFKLPLDAIQDLSHHMYGGIGTVIALVKDIKDNGPAPLVVYDGEDLESSKVYDKESAWYYSFDRQSYSGRYSYHYDFEPDRFCSAYREWVKIEVQTKEYQAEPSAPVKSCLQAVTASLTEKGEELYAVLTDI